MFQMKVVFCGSSLFISGLASGLQSDGKMQVLQLESTFWSTTKELRKICPDVVIFEIDKTSNYQIIWDFLKAHPEMRLIGVEPDRDLLTIFTWQECWTAFIEELEMVITEMPPTFNSNHMGGTGQIL